MILALIAETENRPNPLPLLWPCRRLQLRRDAMAGALCDAPSVRETPAVAAPTREEQMGEQATGTEQEQDAQEDRAPYLEVVTDWVKGVDALDTEDWPGDDLLGMWESDPIRPSGEQEQRFGVLGAVLSEDGLSIGLVVSARLRNY